MPSVGRSLRMGILGYCLLGLANAAQAQRAIPDDNLAYPVLVQPSAGGAASGFYLNTGTSLYLVTAKHVLFDLPSGRLRSPVVNLLSYPRDPKESGKNSISLDLAVLLPAGEVKAHVREDVAVIRVATVGIGTPAEASPRRIELLPGAMVSEATTSGILSVALQFLKKYDEVLVANEVIVFGYPTSLGLKEIPQLDPLRPLLRRGIVAGQNPATKSLVIDCPAYPGNSGGPVVEIVREAFSTHFRVIGVVREFVPFEEKWINWPHGYANRNITNSGYAIATPMDFVLELVK
jgi:hypothetical protein